MHETGPAETSRPSSLLRASDVAFSFGRRGFALGPISLDVGPGVTALMGPNGAGKSTLTRLLATTTRPRSGALEIDGVNLLAGEGRRQARRLIGYVPQHLDFPGWATCVEVLHHAGWLKRLSRADRRQGVERALAALDLEKLAGRRVRTLSGGMRRRLSIAQALVHDPRVLLLDEPTTGLDPQQRVAFRTYIRALGDETSVLLVTHLAEDVAQCAGRVLVIGGGQVRFDGTVESLEFLAGREGRVAASRLEAGLAAVLGTHADEVAGGAAR